MITAGYRHSRALRAALTVLSLFVLPFAAHAADPPGERETPRERTKGRGWAPAVSIAPTVSWFGGELGKVIPGSQLGYELGLFLPVELPRGWELRIGLGGALKGGEVVDSVSFEIPVGLEQTRIYVLRSRMNVNFIHLEAPVLLRAPVPGTGAWPLRWSAGLTPSVRVLEYPNFLFSGPSPPDANRFELSAVFGLGFEWRTPQTINALELRFKGGMTRVFDDFSGRNRAVLLVWSMHR